MAKSRINKYSYQKANKSYKNIIFTLFYMEVILCTILSEAQRLRVSGGKGLRSVCVPKIDTKQ
jgi:hypothetical protein